MIYTYSLIKRATTFENLNSIKTTIITFIALNPFIPGGIFLAYKYVKNITFKINWNWVKWYNEQNHKNYFLELTGWYLF